MTAAVSMATAASIAKALGMAAAEHRINEHRINNNTGAIKMSTNAKTKKKYELTEEKRVMPTGEKVYRIKALRDFDTTYKPVKAGDLGGWVQSEDNLSHEGNCWLFDDAAGYQNSKRTGNAVGYNRSRQYGDSRQFGNSEQYGDSLQFGNSRQYGESLQYDCSRQYGDSQQYERSQQYGNSRQFGCSQQYGCSRQFGWSRLFGSSQQYGNSRTSEDESI